MHGLLALLERGEALDRERLENTLTDGYAWALSLDAECDRLERRISEHPAGPNADGIVQQGPELSALGPLLTRRRHELEALRELIAVLKAGLRDARVA
jgi:hypothetical protein